MKRSLIWIILLVLLAATIAKLAMNKRVVEERVYRLDKSAPIHVGVDTVRVGGTADDRPFGGTVVPAREGRVMAEVPGRVLSVDVQEGQWVEKGTVIVRLDATLMKLQQDAAQVQVETLEKDQARYTILTEADAIQAVQLEKTLLALNTARIQLANVTEQVRRSIITAPFTGQVVQLFVEEGTVVGPSMPVAQLADPRSLEVSILVSEADAHLFQEGDTVSVQVGPTSTPLIGHVQSVGRRGDVAHAFPIRIALPASTGLNPGMSATVQPAIRKGEALPTIPARALVG
ncbi:MAG: efflux RND transporter periplasmic adaptor subunit, partial [Flavobacteriales bacterium]|nr:efflux RND transporter periplasmic adaptor subunit [Flavobacteriales bacterium]